MSFWLILHSSFCRVWTVWIACAVYSANDNGTEFFGGFDCDCDDDDVDEDIVGDGGRYWARKD